MVMAPTLAKRGIDAPLHALIHNWWLVALRGGLAVLFGLSVVVWPDISLPVVVVLFGVYAVVDGMLALAAATRGRLRLLEAWPVALEGVVSVVLGLVALAAPLRVPRDLVLTLVAWGLVTGILEAIEAVRVPRARGGQWLLATASATSLSLAFLLVMLPYAGIDWIAHVMGAYALIFGTALSVVAFGASRRRVAHAARQS